MERILSTNLSADTVSGLILLFGSYAALNFLIQALRGRFCSALLGIYLGVDLLGCVAMLFNVLGNRHRLMYLLSPIASENSFPSGVLCAPSLSLRGTAKPPPATFILAYTSQSHSNTLKRYPAQFPDVWEHRSQLTQVSTSVVPKDRDNGVVLFLNPPRVPSMASV